MHATKNSDIMMLFEIDHLIRLLKIERIYSSHVTPEMLAKLAHQKTVDVVPEPTSWAT